MGDVDAQISFERRELWSSRGRVAQRLTRDVGPQWTYPDGERLGHYEAIRYEAQRDRVMRQTKGRPLVFTTELLPPTGTPVMVWCRGEVDWQVLRLQSVEPCRDGTADALDEEGWRHKILSWTPLS